MKNILKNYIEFYKKNLKKKHIICTIISIILFLIFLIANIQEFEILTNITYSKETYISYIQENLMLNFMIIFAGITPFCFLSIIGFSVVYNIAIQIATIYITTKSMVKLILLCIIAIISLIAYCLCITTGIYYCILSTKRFIYFNKKGFGYRDLKASIYKLRNNEEKLKEYKEKMEEENKKNEKLNVKVPYLNFIISYVISTVIIIITGIFIR